MRHRTALFLVNARSRQGATRAAEAEDALRSAGLVPDMRSVDSPDALGAAIATLGPAADMVVVAGGDGTLNAAAAGLLAAERPLGILPLGTANDLARTLHLPLDLDEAAAVIAAGKTRRIDLGLVNDKPFFNVASIGLSADLAVALTPGLKKRFGRFGYGLAALKVALRASPFHALITTPEESVRVRTFQIAVGNGRFYGGGNAIEKDAAIDDQKLDLYSLEFTRLWTMALMIRAFRRGEQLAWKEVRGLAGTEIEVRTSRPRPVNADGEIITVTPARFTLKARAIEVFCP